MSACIERRSSRLPLFLSLMADYERPCACPTVIDPSPVSPERFFEVLDRATHHRETFLYQAKKCEIEQERRGWIWRRKKRFRLCSGAGRLLFFFSLFPFISFRSLSSTKLNVFWVMSLDNLPCNHHTMCTQERDILYLHLQSICSPELYHRNLNGGTWAIVNTYL